MQIITEYAIALKQCSGCGTPTKIRCVCCGGRFCHAPCEPDDSHAVA